MERTEPLTNTDSSSTPGCAAAEKQAEQELAADTVPSVQYVLFPRKGGWSSFPYPDIVALFAAERGTLAYVSSRSAEQEQLPASIEVIPLSEAEKRLQEPRTVAVVTHPYWLMAVAAMRPEVCIALLPEPVGDEAASPLWESSISRLVGTADLVGTSSETRYMKLLFQGTRAIWLGGEDPSPAGYINHDGRSIPLRDYELFFLHALRQVLTGIPDSITSLQCRVRADYYRELRAKAGAHETISFLLSAYEYLLEDNHAADSLKEAFSHAVMHGRQDCIQSHYRFLSAIHARSGQTEQALQVYGISAGNEQERHHYEQLCRWLEAGEEQLVQAELLRINDDYGSAMRILDELGGETSRHWKFRIYQETERVEEALALIHASDIQDGASLRQYRQLSGAALALRGERHGAVRLFLEIAVEHEDALAGILELELLDQAVQQLLGEVP
ncbi:hypothetical protein HUB98_15380 [Paenibacillus barcinonensis]|uniref:Uncharacterized protein n=1 Tax=Paenibacillus barcinonensis TaxID=198119 RepID=A0A2V4WGA5_PAEBA|nr:hypothetical protein [Paenibacillus barcinonensis]PYE50885.1 hypothetical protein DFQ00_103304 [Paenibacillus barcinonensis]QKS57553.1 hypothetical protein HUB98_15380 [Paenibacillus barcinonensis]